jgi:hypothetical protein
MSGCNKVVGRLNQEKYMTILNLTQHAASAEQKEAGVIDLPHEHKEELVKLLTFEELPSANELAERQVAIARLASDFLWEQGLTEEISGREERFPVVIGGAPVLWKKGLTEETRSREEPFPVMIGGAPFLMAGLEKALRCTGLRAIYAFSRRESVEAVQEDGSVRKVAVFRHLGFVGA